MLSTVEKIYVILKRQDISLSELARRTGQSKQNLSNKMAKGNFKESDLRELSEALGCELEISFNLPDGDKI